MPPNTRQVYFLFPYFPHFSSFFGNIMLVDNGLSITSNSFNLVLLLFWLLKFYEYMLYTLKIIDMRFVKCRYACQNVHTPLEHIAAKFNNQLKLVNNNYSNTRNRNIYQVHHHSQRY